MKTEWFRARVSKSWLRAGGFRAPFFQSPTVRRWLGRSNNWGQLSIKGGRRVNSRAGMDRFLNSAQNGCFLIACQKMLIPHYFHKNEELY